VLHSNTPSGETPAIHAPYTSVEADDDEDPTEVFRPGRHRPVARATPPPPSGDDWEGETRVRRPGTADALPTRRRSRPPEPRQPPRGYDRGSSHNVNPEQTVKLDGDLEFSDPTRVTPPRRPR
jgi:hypothetical protein